MQSCTSTRFVLLVQMQALRMNLRTLSLFEGRISVAKVIRSTFVLDGTSTLNDKEASRLDVISAAKVSANVPAWLDRCTEFPETYTAQTVPPWFSSWGAKLRSLILPLRITFVATP
jgi:hypothetical protein